MRPPGGDIDRTTANDAAGARLIVSLSRQMGTPGRPVVVLAGAPLTNLADAYLLDNTVVERVVVVASPGPYAKPRHSARTVRAGGARPVTAGKPASC